MRQPASLQKNDLIAITCPAGYMPYNKLTGCIETLQRWGYQVLLGNTVKSQSSNYFSATDEERRDELQAMLDAPEVKAILCGRGGYGISRIIDGLNFSGFKKNPKWVIGFSDITLLHCHIHRHCGITSLHAPMANAFNEGGAKNKYVQSLKKSLSGITTEYSCKHHALNRSGKASGQLVGGNLALLTHAIGSASALDTKNKILFIEDIGEHLYQVDRMMMQLSRTGMLKNIAGLVVGHFTDIKDTVRPFGKTVYEIIADHVKDYTYPVCFGFPVGHETENMALKMGADYGFEVGSRSVKLKEKNDGIKH
jgi:muramoyltetrapeptide carboxypeptidase